MKLHLQDIPEGHSRVERSQDSKDLDMGGWFEPQGPVAVALDVDRRGQQLTLRGTATVQAQSACGRCARPVTFRVQSELVVFSDCRGSDNPRDEAALEEQGEVLYHDGAELDLDDSLREALILEVPQVMVCQADCRGLCPRCGQDLNERTCSCAPEAGDPRWGALEGLRNDETE